MPKDPGLKNILLLGSGPIVIGQGCEFDYSGTQACKALREEGCRIILVNSNPATVMTDPAMSDRTYIEPLLPDVVSEIIKKERPDAVLPTMGGQTALNLALDLAASGILEECGVRLIGADAEVIKRAEDREIFRKVVSEIGLDMAASAIAKSFEDAAEFVNGHGFPVVVRPSFTLGGTGGGIAYNLEELKAIVERGLLASMVHEVLIEESLLGWKEIELELIRDKADNIVLICGIENFDPMGVHTGDSIAVAPTQSLSEEEFLAIRKDGEAIVRAIGLKGCGCNLQFAVHPQTGRRAVIEMNPRVSRSSALASKATGYPIARVATKLALGYHLDELGDPASARKSAAQDPVVDYCVVKVPRFDFEKFPGASTVLGFQMMAVGETMALGGNFREAVQKALRGLEIGQPGFTERPARPGETLAPLESRLRDPGPYRIFYLKEAMRQGYDIDRLYEMTAIDPWFLKELRRIFDEEAAIPSVLGPYFAASAAKPGPDEAAQWRGFKASGFSDIQIADIINKSGAAEHLTQDIVRARRLAAGVRPFFRAVETCANKSEASAPYFYSTYEGEFSGEIASLSSAAKKVMILGGGPNRIGQGVEFDYCCVQAAMAMGQAGWETIMVNSNPETVSTDYDMAGRLYFEPLTVEDILAIYEVEKPDGLMIQFGGQTPLNLSRALKKAGAPIIGTSPDDIFMAEDRGVFHELAAKLGIKQPEGGQADNVEAACLIAQSVGYPIMARPDFVLGGRAMRIVHDDDELRAYWDEVLSVSSDGSVFIDRFLEDAIETDVDALCDGRDVFVAAVMEHVEQAGVHSGDSACTIFPRTLTADQVERIKKHTADLALALNTRGLINIQYAIQGDDIYLLEANPRASRTVPFVAKALGWPLARLAALVMAGTPVADLPKAPSVNFVYNAVKEVKMPFDRFPGARIQLGAEMRSTGEVMGLAPSFGQAFLKAQLGAGHRLPKKGGVLLSVCDHDKPRLAAPSRVLAALGYKLYATGGTRNCLIENGLECELVNKMSGPRPDLIDCISDNKIQLAINTISGKTSSRDGMLIRAECLKRRIPTYTTISALEALVEGLQQWDQLSAVTALQDFYKGSL